MAKYHVTFEVKVVDDDPQSTVSEKAIVGVSVEAPTMRDAALHFQQVLQRFVNRHQAGGYWRTVPGVLVPPPGADLSKIGEDDG